MSIMEFINNPSQLLELIDQKLTPVYPKAELIVVFGSVANNTMTVASDIDLLVVSDTLTRKDIFEVMDFFVERYGLGFDIILYTTEQFRTNSNRQIIKTARSEGVILWEKEKTS